MTDAPDWLITAITPKPRKAKRKSDAVPKIAKPDDPEALRAKLADLEPELADVDWRKEIEDGRIILVGRCPFEHPSGTSSDSDLSADFTTDGRPYVTCLHQNCTEIPAVSKQLCGTDLDLRPAGAYLAPETIPGVDLTPIVVSMREDLDAALAALHTAPPGAGKTYALCLLLITLYRSGQAGLIALPTNKLAHQVVITLRTMAPALFERDAVAEVFGRRCRKNSMADGDEADDDDDDLEGDSQYPIHPWTRTIVCTHQSFSRRTFSRYIRPIWSILGAIDERPPFTIIIDEIASLVRECEQEIALYHRVLFDRISPDGTHIHRSPLDRCPKTTRSENCLGCHLIRHGGATRFRLTYGLRELQRPQPIDIPIDGVAPEPVNVLRLPDDFMELGPEMWSGATDFAVAVTTCRGEPIGNGRYWTAEIKRFRTVQSSGQMLEPSPDIVANMLTFAFRPMVKASYPMDDEGNKVDVKVLRERIRDNKRRWQDRIVFPYETCNAPRLMFTDLQTLEQIRRFSEENHLGGILTGANIKPDSFTAEVLREVWPGLVFREHPYPDRKIKQVALVMPRYKDLAGMHSMVDDGDTLITRALEEFGRGLIFLPTKRIARVFYRMVRAANPGLRLAIESDIPVDFSATVYEDEPIKIR